MTPEGIMKYSPVGAVVDGFVPVYPAGEGEENRTKRDQNGRNPFVLTAESNALKG